MIRINEAIHPDEVLSRGDVSQKAKTIYLEIYSLQYHRDIIYPTIAKLSAFSEYGACALRSGIKELRLAEAIKDVQSRVPLNRKCSGYVYLIHAIGCGRYKIGSGANPYYRLAQFKNAQPPFPLELVHFFFHENAGALEVQLHGSFDSCRVHGEWFELTSEAVIKFCSFPNSRPLNYQGGAKDE